MKRKLALAWLTAVALAILSAGVYCAVRYPVQTVAFLSCMAGGAAFVVTLWALDHITSR